MDGFVFDLDNTLYDRYGTLTRIFREGEREIISYLNPVYDTEQALSHLLHTEPLYIMDDWGAVYERLCAEHFFNAAHTPGYDRFMHFIHEGFRRVAVTFPFVEPLLRDLKRKGYKLGILSNGLRELQMKKLGQLGIAPLFDQVLTSGMLSEEMYGVPLDKRCHKPNRVIFDAMAKRLGTTNDKLYYVGDNPKNDYMGAKAAGYVPVWIASRSPWPYEQMPEIWFKSAEGVRALTESDE